jgi:hypothetical protein
VKKLSPAMDSPSSSQSPLSMSGCIDSITKSSRSTKYISTDQKYTSRTGSASTGPEPAYSRDALSGTTTPKNRVSPEVRIRRFQFEHTSLPITQPQRHMSKNVSQSTIAHVSSFITMEIHSNSKTIISQQTERRFAKLFSDSDVSYILT